MKKVGFLSIVLTGMFLIQQCGPPSVNLQEVDEVLTKIAAYQYGDSQEPLVRLQEIMQLANGKPELIRVIESRILKTLQSNATLAGKQHLCKKIIVVGSEASIPVLAQMLLNPETTDMARYALEVMPAPQADSALRLALPVMTGDYKCGIINSLGRRGDAQAVPLLAPLLADNDSNIVTAAIAALGDIATPEAESVLKNSMGKFQDQTARQRALDAYLKYADHYASANNTEKASTIYRELIQPKYPQPIRVAALHGLITLSREEGIDLVNTILRGSDTSLKLAVMGLIPDLPRIENVRELHDSFKGLNASLKVSFLAGVKTRRDVSFLPLVKQAVLDEEQDVRVAALDALAAVGDAASVRLLAQTAAEKVDPEQKTARESLYLLNAQNVDQTIIQQIPTAKDDIKIELIYAVGERRIGTAAQILFTLAQDENPKIRMAVYRALALVAKPDKMPLLVDYLVNSQRNSERKELERALVTLAQKMDAEENKTAPIVEVLPAVTDKDIKASFFMVLGRIGEKRSLPLLRDALGDADLDLRGAAIRALSEWPNATPKDDLLQVARTTETPAHKVLALRGYIDLLSNLPDDISQEEKTSLYRQVFDLEPAPQELQRALSGLMRVGGVDALELAAKYLDHVEVKEEAAITVTRLAWSTARDDPEKTITYLEKVLAVAENERTREMAQNMLDRMEQREQD
jgi:HEAT repeat protein